MRLMPRPESCFGNRQRHREFLLLRRRFKSTGNNTSQWFRDGAETLPVWSPRSIRLFRDCIRWCRTAGPSGYTHWKRSAEKSETGNSEIWGLEIGQSRYLKAENRKLKMDLGD